MDTIVTILAWTNLVLVVVVLRTELLRLGEGHFRDTKCIWRLVSGAMLIVLIGRCLRWW